MQDNQNYTGPLFKFKFEVVYQTKYCKEVSNLLQKCDLNTGDICFVDTIILSCRKDNEISKIKESLKQCLEACECTVFRIEGGKIE